ncbi:hypothetical protein EZ428_02655 [Pedobacter frigiditerrae]|uniref:Holliday junction resolvase RuvC n=1 Tax=Pedobacter frigiditerrae TaxID=2530452 RepID=A0A4R0N1J8_9SPHI|nr:hypothetical protein [Pedobacter frigiditerrae]TCC93688.1 hypothetical protein EZ428_02655 [Pedobacter frigiditerrae]
MTILGISVGTTRTGIAVIKNGVLLSREMHNFDAVWSKKKLNAIIKLYRHYVEKAEVTGIIIKVPPLSKHDKPIKSIIRGIERLALKYGCEHDYITKREIKERMALRRTDELIKFTLKIYPNLGSLPENRTNNYRNYSTKLYEAVLSAHLFYKRQLMKIPE